MPGPATANDALSWIRDAMARSRYIPAVHLFRRMSERRITLDDLKRATAAATSCMPYSEPPQHGGTSWRVYGPDVDGACEIGVGYEAFRDHLGKRVVIVTVLVRQEK
jgi:hypothetical protein